LLAILLAATCLVGLFALGLLFAFTRLPDVSVMKKCVRTSMYGVDLCPSSSKFAKLSEVSPTFLQALVQTEDASFYAHNGFDFNEVRNSLRTNLQLGTSARGASTITQQLAKNVFLSPEKTMQRKFLEAYLTTQIEKKFSKAEILERYINVVEFGEQIYGVKAASQFYFSKSPSKLNSLESAFLVMLLPNPKKYSASFRAKKLTDFDKSRIRLITQRLFKSGRISELEYRWSKRHIEDFPWRGIPTAHEEVFESGEWSFADDENVEVIEDESFEEEVAPRFEPENSGLSIEDEIKHETGD